MCTFLNLCTSIYNSIKLFILSIIRCNKFIDFSGANYIANPFILQLFSRSSHKITGTMRVKYCVCVCVSVCGLKFVHVHLICIHNISIVMQE